MSPSAAGSRARRRPRRPSPNAPPPASSSTRSPRELRKVAWPTRSETLNYSIIVFVALVVLTSFIFVVDYFFSQLVLKLFNA